MNRTEIDVVVRCRNEMPFVKQTLESLLEQRDVAVRILFIDSGSTDGSREVAEAMSVQIVDVAPEYYIPGRVLNLGLAMARSEVVAFVNADAVPLSNRSLASLIRPFSQNEKLAATYGRQVARPDADAWTRADYARAFDLDAALPLRGRVFFSMAASALRRSVWEHLPFDEQLRYSEDVEWTSRARLLGCTIDYVPEAGFEHSHNYGLVDHFRRRRGEGSADTTIFRSTPRVSTDLVRPLSGALVRDLSQGRFSAYGVALRVCQTAGYYAGRRAAAPKRPL